MVCFFSQPFVIIPKGRVMVGGVLVFYKPYEVDK